MEEYITGIQQVGIGVENTCEAKIIYRDLFGMSTLVFEDTSTADLMQQYTGDRVHKRHAVLSLNMAGGGGFEIWQFLSRQPAPQNANMCLGDAGIYAVKIKARNIEKAHEHFKKIKTLNVSAVSLCPENNQHFLVTDKYNNRFDIIESNSWFKKNKSICGGVCGAVIGVNDMDEAVYFYKNVFGINETVFDKTDHFSDFPQTAPDKLYRRVLLKKSTSKKGAFANLLGFTSIELVELKNGESNHIFKNRYWGDCGFIHLCFDVFDMDALKLNAEKFGYHFSVDSNASFSMGSSAGRFCYIEDPCGTLIELVETHKVPILKKLGLFLDLTKRKAKKPLPNWVIGLMALNKIKK
jgi:catechol 2,3-dioxygenase-like lactoylglutathione lyase family enzyme